VDRLGAGIERALDTDAKELPVIGARTHVIDITAVADLATLAISLGFVLVIDSIEAAVEIILILAPSDASHYVNAISVRPPGFHPCRQVGVDAVNDGHVRTQISLRTPGGPRLETGAFMNSISAG